MTAVETLAPVAASPEPLTSQSPSYRRIGYRIARGIFSGAVTLAVVLGFWVLFLKIFHVSSFIGKTPLDVWRYTFTAADAGANRHALINESGTTLRDAFLGLGAGTVAAVACAIAFNLWSAAASAFMPMAMVLRSVPLVAMTPLIVGIFGRNLKAITIIAGIVTFFPTLVNVTLALKRTPRESLDLCRAYGASSAETLWRVQIPSALPSLFASLRIAAPLSLVGALLAEWLATGQGLGYKMLDAMAVSDYNGLWARVVLVTLYSALMYQLIGIVERIVLKRFGALAH
jgi:ABC-type nitrate/sulfonate/bicarbonate transport system permease component